MKYLNRYIIVFILLIVPSAILLNIDDKNTFFMGLILFISGLFFAFLFSTEKRNRKIIDFLNKLF
ncbi:hypothetical protein CRU96_06955 [Malaciobacter halophilus]|nr:hypothetical protein CRU96_06955 [Malaciobacter halophilus]